MKRLLHAAVIGLISPVLLAGSRVYAALTVKATAAVTQPTGNFSFPVRTMNSVTRASSHKVEVSGGSSGQIVRIDAEMDIDNWATGNSQTGEIISSLLTPLDVTGKYAYSKRFSYSVNHGNSATGSQSFTVSAFTDITANNTINDHTTATKAYSVSYY